MRLIKMLSLAVAATVVATAFIVVPSAVADAEHIVVCGKAELTCESPLVTEIKEGKPVAQIHGAAKNPKLITSIGTIECKESLANITTLNELGKLLVGHITELSFSTETSECFLGGTKCTVTVKPLGLVSFTKTGALTANATSTGGTEANVKCGFLINCTYGGEPILEVHSLATGETKLLANETELIKSKGICPKTSKWLATYNANGTMWVES